MAEKPDFVFGQEVYHYGFATALCPGVTRVLFPWGYDIHEYSASPAAFRLVRWCLRQADLVVPGSWEAADYIRQRFQIADDRVIPIRWGVDPSAFRAAGTTERITILEEYGIRPSSVIVSNVRRGLRDWGFDVALESFGRLAAEFPSAHFILLGGADGKAATSRVREVSERCGAPRRFTCFESEIPLERVAQLMSVTDVFLSLPQFTDMRSRSVLQAAACGGTPVVADQPESRRMLAEGFRALLVDAASVDAVVDAVRAALSSDPLRRDMAQANRAYTETYENWNSNMDHLLDLIGTACEKRRHGRRSR